MGRYYPDKKMTVESCLNLDIRSLKKSGFLSGEVLKCATIEWFPGVVQTGSVQIVVILGLKKVDISYTLSQQDGDKRNYSYAIHLDSTPCPLGGLRWWFICPLEGCERRVGVLYLPPGAERFGCRHCYNLTYQSVQKHDKRAYQWMNDPGVLVELLNPKNARKGLHTLRTVMEELDKLEKD